VKVAAEADHYAQRRAGTVADQNEDQPQRPAGSVSRLSFQYFGS
jgi:hypothetical protein